MEETDHREMFRNSFHETLKEQADIRKKLTGQKIIEIFYSSGVEGWNIEIKDDKVIHLPMGTMILKCSDNCYYRINTNYQTWCGGIYGILLESVKENELSQKKYDTDKDHINSEKNWAAISNAEITAIDWNWKREPDCKLDGKKMTVKEAEKFLQEDCFLPDNLVFTFSNGEKIFIFALEPDAEIKDKGTYTFISGGEELMIFFKADRLQHWGINTLGFEILPG